jgi:3-hydroxyisobutyrate dehydrogenase-like beta-hydroxyacid dehydrogenase
MTDGGSLGFIGLGVMGEKMCGNILRKSGRSVVVFDSRAEPVSRLTAAGAIAAESIVDVARKVDVVFLCLPGEPEVRAVCLGEGGILGGGRKGLIVVDMSTNAVQCARDVAKSLAEKGIEFADAPVSRTREAAAAGTLSIMVGASPEVFARIKPLLDCMGSDITHCGGVGNGEIVKILNNMLNFEITLAVAEALALGVKAGMEPKLLLETLSKGSSNSFVLQQHGMKFMLPRQFPKAAFSPRYVLKDLSYALKLGDENGQPMEIGHLAWRYYSAMIDEGMGEEYFPAVIKLVEQGRSFAPANGKNA